MLQRTFFFQFSELPDVLLDLPILQSSIWLQDYPDGALVCAKEENCLSSVPTPNHHMRRLLRFSSGIMNRGTAPFKPFLSRSDWEWHACHMWATPLRFYDATLKPVSIVPCLNWPHTQFTWSKSKEWSRGNWWASHSCQVDVPKKLTFICRLCCGVAFCCMYTSGFSIGVGTKIDVFICWSQGEWFEI